jgi:hypothetical protein
VPEHLISEELIPAVNVYDVRFKTPKGKELSLRDRDGSLEYLLRRAEIISGDKIVYPAQLVDNYMAGLSDAIGNKPRRAKIPLTKGSRLTFPGLEKPVYVSALHFTYKLITTRHLVTAGWNISALAPQYKLENELTGTSNVIKSRDVALGFDTKITPGRYYQNPVLGNSYYCSEVRDGTATLILLECYRGGNLLQATFTQSTEHEKHYVEVTDRQEIDRLSKLYAAYLKPPERPPNTSPTDGPRFSRIAFAYDEASNLTVVEALYKKGGGRK